MTTVEYLFNQQYGNCKLRRFDAILKRLRCCKDDQFTHVLPMDDHSGGYDTPIFACKFAQTSSHENLVALANEDGKLAIHDITGKEERFGVKAHDNAIFDIAWMFGNMQIATASGDHTARLFDISPGGITEVSAFVGHSRSVKTIASKKDDHAIFATGGRDGTIMIWDTRIGMAANVIGKAEKAIHNSHNCTPSKFHTNFKRRSNFFSTHTNISTKSVTGLVFQCDNTLISCGAGDGFIKIWDCRRNYLTHKQEPLPKFRIPYSGGTYKNGFSSIILDETGLKLYANCLDNTIYCYNVGTYNTIPIMKYVGHQNNTFYIKSSLTGDGNYLISGSSDENAYIWNVNYPHPFVKLMGHNAEVTCVACCSNDFAIVTCSDDMTHRIWRVGGQALPENWEVIGRGKAEILPICSSVVQHGQKRGWHEPLDENMFLKKFITTCIRCQNVNATPTSAKCINCQNLKRNIDNDEGSSCFVPRKLFSSLHNLQEELSDLPNFVVDGTAPHLVYSPPKKKQQDWLTLMRTEKQLKRRMEELTNPILSKMARSDITPRYSPQPRSRCSSPIHSPILRFFKQTNSTIQNNCKSNGSCNKGHMASPQSSQ